MELSRRAWRDADGALEESWRDADGALEESWRDADGALEEKMTFQWSPRGRPGNRT